MNTNPFLSVAGACLLAAASPASALNIALTNDDGYGALGIQAMKTALEAAGHQVTLAAPLTDAGGSGTGFDQEALTVKRWDTNVYSVALRRDPTIAAKPSNSAYVALSIAAEGGQPVDLLISGINTSSNLGLSAFLSGTVGAANHAATSVLNGPVPAIAIGTDEPDCDMPCKQAHYSVVANFVVRFVAHLQTKPGFLASEAGLLPQGIALVISHPGTAAVAGVKVGVLSEGIMLAGSKVAGEIRCTSPCSAIQIGATKTAAPFLVPDYSLEVKDSDIGYYTEGYVTIVPIRPNFTAPNPLQFKSILPGLTP
jgi:5'/3'-nucleotidase SurE